MNWYNLKKKKKSRLILYDFKISGCDSRFKPSDNRVSLVLSAYGWMQKMIRFQKVVWKNRKHILSIRMYGLDADLAWFTVITLRLITNLNVTLKALNIQVETMSILPNAWVVSESSAVICLMSIRDLCFIFKVTINEI